LLAVARGVGVQWGGLGLAGGRDLVVSVHSQPLEQPRHSESERLENLACGAPGTKIDAQRL